MDTFTLGLLPSSAATLANAAMRLSSIAALPFADALQSAEQSLHEQTDPAAAFSLRQRDSLAALDDVLKTAEKLPVRSQADFDAHADVTQLEAEAVALRADIKRGILHALSEAGIRLDEPISLELSPRDGSIEVTGAHPQRAVIEAVLNKRAVAAGIRTLQAIHEFLSASSDPSWSAQQLLHESAQAAPTRTNSISTRNAARLQVSVLGNELRLNFA